MWHVDIQSVSRDFGVTRALDGVSLGIGEGELVALLGPSGCGKTTLLRCVAGLTQPDGGRIHFAGLDVTDLPPRARDVGMVFQSYALFPNLTAAGNVAFPLEARGWPTDQLRPRVAELMGLVGLEREAGRFPHELSGGQQQRVALARALAPRPRVLLLDEPLSALDALTRTVLRDEIRRIQLALGTTALYVTHDQAEALAVADRVGVMEGGRLVELGPPAEVYRQPQSQFGAAFLGGRNALSLTIGADGWARCGEAFALPVSEGKPGSRIVATFPPESVFLTEGAGLAGRVLMVSFRGALTRVRVATERGEISADLLSMEAPDLQRDEAVRLSVRSEMIRFYPVEAGVERGA
jgi:putative spermidine/putrescine transport system ATP-binding protein